MSRYARNDSALIMEKVAIDLGQWIAHARSVLGYEKVVLVGWSGGGSLSLFYQAQAEQPTITRTPAGDDVDLTQEDMQPADGVIFIAAHLSRAETLTEWIGCSSSPGITKHEAFRIGARQVFQKSGKASQACPNSWSK